MARARRRAASSVSMRGMEGMIREREGSGLHGFQRAMRSLCPRPLIRARKAPPMPFRTICQAIEDASKAEPTRGYRIIPDTGVPGYDAPGADLAAGAEASFSYTAVERLTARFGGALQVLVLRKGDRVALIL